MANIKSNKYFRKWKWFILFFVVCALIVSLSNYIFVYKAPERELTKNFVLANRKIQAEFGEPFSIKVMKSAKISYKQNKREGTYTFDIKGSKKTGTIRVRWHSRGAGIDFVVDTIELLKPRKNPLLIWSHEPNE
jgi:hypothetical protein